DAKFQLWMRQGFQTFVFASTQSQLERIRFLLEERGLPCRIENQSTLGEAADGRLIRLCEGSLSEGFRWPSEGWVIVTEEEILGTRHVKRQERASMTQ